MDKNNELIILYDYYGTLLTDKQQSYFEDYYFNNFTLSEISENCNVSRNAIHKQLKEVEEKLYYYESKLLLLEKNKKISFLLEKLDNEDLKNKIEELL